MRGLWGWVRSFWLQPDGSVCQVYLLIASISLMMDICWGIIGSDFIKSTVIFFLPGMVIAYLSKRLEWKDQQIVLTCSALNYVAIQGCRCNNFPEEDKGSCHVCHARIILKETCPDKFLPALD